MKGQLSGIEMGWMPHLWRRWCFRRMERKNRLRRLSATEMHTPLILTDKGWGFCPICKCRLIGYLGVEREDLLVCPSWHYGMVILSGFDIRSHNSVLEALPTVRELPVRVS